MKRTDALTIGQIVQNFMQHEHLDTRLDEIRASAIWPEIVGHGVNRYTASRNVANGVMTVHITSAPLRNELMLSRSTIIAQLNTLVGKKVIREIIFR